MELSIGQAASQAGFWDWILAALSLAIMVSFALFCFWVFRSILSGILTLMFERHKLREILDYAGDKNTPVLLKPFAYVAWAVLSVIGLVFLLVFGWWLMNMYGNLKDR